MEVFWRKCVHNICPALYVPYLCCSCDKNGDGRITGEEVKEVCTNKSCLSLWTSQGPPHPWTPWTTSLCFVFGFPPSHHASSSSSSSLPDCNACFEPTRRDSEWIDLCNLSFPLQVIVLSASANKLTKLKEQAEEYAALIMEELDVDQMGYIEVHFFFFSSSSSLPSSNVFHVGWNQSAMSFDVQQ